MKALGVKPHLLLLQTLIMSNNDKEAQYESQVVKLGSELKKLESRRSSFAWLRLGSIAAIILAFYLLWQAGIAFVILAAVILLIVFARLVYADIRNHEKIHFTKTLIRLYQDEIAALKGAFPFDDGKDFIQKEHLYTSDLDIFGERSLFQYLNRTSSDAGAENLAAYLNHKASLEEIKLRQESVVELATDPGWLKKIHAFGILNRFTRTSENRLKNWIATPPSFLPFKSWSWLRYLLPALSVAMTVLYITGAVNLITWLIVLLIMATVVWQIDKVVAPIHRQLDEIASQLGSISLSLEMIEQRFFQSQLLKDMREGLLANHSKASSDIRKIKKILDRLDLRYNMVLAWPLNLLLLWNLQQILELEKWKAVRKEFLPRWIDTLSTFEALNSLANFAFNHPSYSFPEVTGDYFSLEGKDIGHPLIAADKRVNNPVALPSNGKLLLITGSNMAGKSTYLRSIGVNCVLAFCGAPVCATYFKVSLVDLISSMRVADNLQESTSTFYAELKKLKIVIDHVNRKDNVLILLDEILRGTNSHDRHTGSKALIKQLIRKKSAGIIATHDLELAEMKESFAENILNYHFDVQVSNEELYFDYKLKPGICKSMNASILMKKIGIEMDDQTDS